MAGMHRSFRHWNWSSSHSLTAPARHGAAPGSAGRAPTAGRQEHPGAASPPGPGRAQAGQGVGSRRPRVGGWGWARQGRAVRCGAGGDAPPREDGGDPEAALCRDKRDRSRASPHCFKGRGKRSLGIEDG